MTRDKEGPMKFRPSAPSRFSDSPLLMLGVHAVGALIAAASMYFAFQLQSWVPIIIGGALMLAIEIAWWRDLLKR
ncbi:hypothetical protein CDL60_22175 [Roseateles noduli]|nr:hypothetical protein CDL60_22175 [Roseateles noduli]